MKINFLSMQLDNSLKYVKNIEKYIDEKHD